MSVVEAKLPPSVFEGLNRVGPLPLYFQIAENIEQAIIDGGLPVESWLQNEITLAGQLKTSRSTTRRALEELVHRGLLVRQQGRGTQVVSGTAARATRIRGLFDELVADGYTPTTQVLETSPSYDASLQFADGPQTDMHLIKRLRSANGHPVAILTNWLPSSLAIPLIGSLEFQGLYAALRLAGQSFRTLRQTIGSRIGNAEECELLELVADSLVLTVERVAFDPQDRFICAGTHCYRPDGRSFSTTTICL